MAGVKRTKRVRHESEDMGLEEHISLKRCELVKERNKAGDMILKAQALQSEASSMDRPWQQRLKKDKIDEANAMLAEAAILKSMVREHEFEETVVSYLRMYHWKTPERASASCKRDSINAHMKHTDQLVHRRSLVLEEYLTHMNNALPKVWMASRDECPRCENSPKLLLCNTRSIMSCPECGYAVTYLDASSSATSFDDIVEFSQYSYKRVNHYMMWLTLVQGKEAHRVSDDVLEAVAKDLHSSGVKTLEDITQKRVRASLRKLKLKRAYDHVTQITFRLNGMRPPRLTAETEERLKNMFLQMQPAFQRHAPKNRTNFLSYSFVLYRCFQILGLNQMLDGITLLKGRDKLEANDRIFRKMCEEDLGWPVFDLPSDV